MSLSSGLSDAAVTRHEAMDVLYLHGFTSSSHSTKAVYLAERLREHGVALRSPDFNQSDFSTLTMTRMLDQLAMEVGDGTRGPLTLVGSSLGGTLAVLAAARMGTRVDRLVLLAPAVMFGKPGDPVLPPERIEDWRRRGAMPFFHYAHNEERLLNYAFYEDSVRHDGFGADFPQPALIFQGLRDGSVDHRTVEAFARTRPNVTLSLLDDDHQLMASLPRIWNDMEAFLGLAR